MITADVAADTTTTIIAPDVSTLPTWRQAIVAATANDTKTMRRLLAAEPGLRALRVSAEDSSYLSTTLGVHVVPGRLLIESAIERDHEELVICLLYTSPSPRDS